MTLVLRALLATVGLAIIGLGLNVSLGGIQTLGWQGAGNFVQVTDASLFAVRDNHIRFIAGVWTAAGGVMVLGAFALNRLAPVLEALTAMIFVGGLARLSASDIGLILSPSIAPSLVVELVLIPFLGLWIHLATRRRVDV